MEKTMEDWESMLHFAIHLIMQSKVHKGQGILGDRIIILHLDHANELLMKSFLLRSGYVIEYVDRNDVNDGLKVEDLAQKSKTIDYVNCLERVCKLTKFEPQKKRRILEFHKIRNEIQHRCADLPLEKGEEIEKFYPCFMELYSKMFPQFADAFPKFSDLV